MVSKDFSETANNAQSTGSAAVCERNQPGRAEDIMKCGVTTVAKDKSVYEAVEIMVRKGISGLPVVDDTGLVGLISEKDVLKLMYDKEFISGSVADYMTADIVSFDEQDSLADICECLINNHFRRVPILRQGKLVGIISRADLIRANKDKFKPHNPAERSREQKKGLLARDIMKCGLITVQRQTPIYEAIEILAARHITGLPVVDDCMNLVGIVSEKDMLKLLYDPAVEPGNTEDFMTKEVVGFNHDDSLLDVCDCLVNSNFRRVPILNQGKVVGIISRADVIVCILKRQISRFKQGRPN